MTPAQLWAQMVNSRFSMAKRYHVSSAAEACKRCWLGVGCLGFLGPARSILVVRRRQVCVSQPGMGGPVGGACGRATVDVITPALSTAADICLTRAGAPLPSPPPPSLISPSPGSCSVMNSPYSPANDCL